MIDPELWTLWSQSSKRERRLIVFLFWLDARLKRRRR